MKNKMRLTFGKPINIPSGDAVTYRFPFSAVEAHKVGSPEEARVTTQHSLTVKASGTRLGAWKLAGDDLMKELFEIGKRKLLERAAQGSLKADEIVIVNAKTHHCTPPFDPSRVTDPEGRVVTVEPAPRRIGF